MSVIMPPRPTGHLSNIAGVVEIVKLVEGIHDDVAVQEVVQPQREETIGEEEVAGVGQELEDIEEVSGPSEARPKKASRKTRRGGKAKTAKANKKKAELEEQAKNNDDDNSSNPASEASAVMTEPLLPPYQPPELPEPIPYVHVDVVPTFEFRTIPGAIIIDSILPALKTDKRGLVATEHIEQGARIISERAAFSLPAPGDQLAGVWDAFNQLDQHSREDFYSLNPCDSSVHGALTYIAETIMTKMAIIKMVSSKPASERTDEVRATIRLELPHLAQCAELWRVAARWYANRWSMTNLPEDQRESLAPGTPINGLFVKTAQLGHSCVPNCHAHYNVFQDRMTVQAIKPVVAGEELTISAIPLNYYLSAAERTDQLKKKFGIQCDCEACSPGHHKFASHQAARLAAYTRGIQVNHFATTVEVVGSDRVLADLCLTREMIPAHPSPTLQQLRDVQDTALALIRNLQAAGGSGVEQIRWYNALIDRVQPRLADELDEKDRLMYWSFMLRHAGECEKLAVRCFGADTAEVWELKKRKERIDLRVKVCMERMEEVDKARKRIAL